MDWEASVGPSDYEYADVRLSPNIFLGRWNPLADGARRAPPPAAAISGGFVAVKVLQSRFAAVNPKGVSRELEAHMRTCRSEQESPGARHFVRLIDAYGRPSEEVDFKVFLIQVRLERWVCHCFERCDVWGSLTSPPVFSGAVPGHPRGQAAVGCDPGL